jgi:Holliday junction DNA helicase RuvB
LTLPHFTLVGATTRAGLLPAPLRDRFGFTAHLDFYDEADISQIVLRSAALLDVKISQSAITELGKRSRGTPRIANRLLRRVRDFAQVHGDGAIDLETTRSALTMYEVDEIGLDRLDTSILRALVEQFGGGPVGLNTLAMAVGEERETVESVAEPFLVRSGFMVRSPRGRAATAAAWHHLGKTPPAQSLGLFDSPDIHL